MGKDLIEFLAKSLCRTPDAVSVSEDTSGQVPVIQLRLSSDDMGALIGRYGRIARAIRVVLSAASFADGRRRTLDILD